jgi:hypothetical protein
VAPTSAPTVNSMTPTMPTMTPTTPTVAITIQANSTVELQDKSGQYFFENGGPQEWHLSNAHWTKYPFNIQDFERGYHPGQESNCGFQRLRQRLDAGEPIRINVYGGSMSTGEYCHSPTNFWKEGHVCSWVSRLKAWVAFQFPKWRLSIENNSHGGWGIKHFNRELVRPDSADAYIFESTMNTHRNSLPNEALELLSKLSGPKLFLAVAPTCGRYCHVFEDDPVCNGSRMVYVDSRYPFLARSRYVAQCTLLFNNHSLIRICGVFPSIFPVL